MANSKSKYLLKLRKGLKGLPAAEVESAAAYYGALIDDLLDEGRSMRQVEEQIGAPDVTARRIMSESAGGPVGSGRVRGGEPLKEKAAAAAKNFMSGKWKWFWIFWIVTIPLTIALFSVILGLACAFFGIGIGILAVLLSLIVSGFAMVIAGPLVVIYGAVVGIMSGSFMVALIYAGGGLILAGVGLIIAWASKFIFQIFKSAARFIFKKRLR